MNVMVVVDNFHFSTFSFELRVPEPDDDSEDAYDVSVFMSKLSVGLRLLLLL